VEAKYGREVWSIHAIRSERRRKYWSLRWQFEELSRLVELKLFQNAGHFLSQIKELFQHFQDEQKQNEQKRLRREMAALTVAQLTIAFATVYFILEVVNGGLMVGTLVFVLASIAGLRQALGGLFMNLGQQYQDSLFITDIFKLLDIEPALVKPPQGFILPHDETPEIVFDHVSFAYPGTDKAVLKNFSLKVEPGEKVALIGANGAGKTTIVKLLCRFYDPTEGRILIGGRDIREIDIESWYSILGALFQDYAHYPFIVKETIALGRTGSPLAMDQVKNAARSSEADTFIEEWKNKYEQMLGKDFTGGIEPSIGQWQKLAISRAFYRNARVLILDEPTSSIDAEAEAKIFDRLEKETRGKTVILISHRFSTVRHATKIAVLENGRLKELGRHEELLKKKGLYARLFNLQAKGYR
jgi:ATP-binding cassette subfamily B protein